MNFLSSSPLMWGEFMHLSQHLHTKTLWFAFVDMAVPSFSMVSLVFVYRRKCVHYIWKLWCNGSIDGFHGASGEQVGSVFSTTLLSATMSPYHLYWKIKEAASHKVKGLLYSCLLIARLPSRSRTVIGIWKPSLELSHMMSSPSKVWRETQNSGVFAYMCIASVVHTCA